MLFYATDLDHFRFREDDEDEANATWKAALNTDVSIPADETFRIRLGITEVNADGDTGKIFRLVHRINGAAWISHDTTASRAVMPIDSAWIANQSQGEATTQQLSSPNTFNGGRIMDSFDMVPDAATHAASSTREYEFALKFDIDNLDTTFSVTDTVEFALTINDVLPDTLSQIGLATVATATNFISQVYWGGTRQDTLNWGTDNTISLYWGSTQVY